MEFVRLLLLPLGDGLAVFLLLLQTVVLADTDCE